MTTPVQATVTPEDTKAAHDVLWKTECHGGPIAESIRWPRITVIGEAIAQALANAREAGRREAFGEADVLVKALEETKLMASCIGLKQTGCPPHVHESLCNMGDFDTMSAREVADWLRRIEDIASRAIAEYGKAGT